MKNVIDIDRAVSISRGLKKSGKSIVLVGGCFDILHVGHLRFLLNAKKQGDILFVLLESDENVKKLKGKNRPINIQKERAELLSYLYPVDYVVLLPPMQNDQSYDKLISQILPDVLAMTNDEPGAKHQARQAELINAKAKPVIKRLKNRSTTIVNKLAGK